MGGSPLLFDPWFYAVAVPGVILLGISKSGFGTGFGSLVVPMMALVIPVPQAAAILMPVLLALDLMGIWAYRRDWDRQLFWFLLPWAVVGIVMGYFLFRLLDPKWVAGIVGAMTLLFLAMRFIKRHQAPTVPSSWFGRLMAALSGFTSFVSHSGGPPLNMYVLRLGLAPVPFAATMAFLFFCVNLCKWLPYGLLGLLDWSNLMLSLVLIPISPIGVWLGVKWARRIDPKWFFRLVYAGMLFTGVKLLSDALI